MNERIWIDWDRPLIPRAVRWLNDRFGNERIGLRDVVCVLPGRRAGRLLLAEMLKHADRVQTTIVAPEVLTPGLLKRSLDAQPSILDRTASIAAWMRAIGNVEAHEIDALIPDGSSMHDAIALHRFAWSLHDLFEQIAGEGIWPKQIASAAKRINLHHDVARWQAIDRLHQTFTELVSQCGTSDPYTSPWVAIDHQTVRDHRALVIIGVAQLNQLQRHIIKHHGGPVHVLIHAPETLADHFDDLGCVIPDMWLAHEINIDDDRMTIAQHPSDQAQAAISFLAGFDTSNVDDVTIGLADESLADAMHMAGQWADVEFHDAAGRAARRSRPVMWLDALATFMESPRHRSLAALARHPDCAVTLPQRSGSADWLLHLDRSYAEHLDESLKYHWDGEDASAAVSQQLAQAARELTASLDTDIRSLAAWSPRLLDILRTTFTSESASLTFHDRQILGALADHLATWRNVPPRLQPELDGIRAIRWLLADMECTRVPEQRTERAINMLGWLEVHLDTAPSLVMLGMNDGAVPRRATADPFLPDQLRKAVGLAHAEATLARDTYLLEATLHSKERVKLVAGRRSSDGEPLLPSPLLLKCNPHALPNRITRLCGDAQSLSWPLPAGCAAFSPISRFVIPELPDLIEPPESLSASAFKEYLHCPYRYALNRVLRLEAVTDALDELDPMQFGTLAHDVLCAFGQDASISASTDSKLIETYLLDTLSDLTTRRFGDTPLPAIRLQLSRLDPRLREFAQLQAQLRSDGWRIEHCEHTLNGPLALVDGDEQQIEIRARADRIDRHEDQSLRLILDYKTGDKGETPIQTHHGRKHIPSDPAWLDLQMPLYRHLARAQFEDADIRLGYIVLPRNAGGVRIHYADWSHEHIDDALHTARDIVRRILNGEFTMNSEAGSVFDPFARICQSFAFSDDDAEEGGDE